MNKLNFEDFINPDNDPVNELDILKMVTVNHLLSKDNLKSNTRLKQKQVPLLSKMYLFGEVFNVPFITQLANNISELQISINGLGRKELVDLVGKVYNPFSDLSNENNNRKDIFRWKAFT